MKLGYLSSKEQCYFDPYLQGAYVLESEEISDDNFCTKNY